MSLIDIKEHLIQEIKWLKYQIDCVENEEEENEMCYDCGYNPDNDKGIEFHFKLELAEELLNNFFPEPFTEKEKKLIRRENVHS